MTDRTGRARFVARGVGGFTLTELALVIVIGSILAALALPKINTLAFDLAGFADRARAMIRYAQRTAITQRRLVYVVVEGGPTLSLCYIDAGCASRVTEPGPGGAFSASPPSSVMISGPSPNFSFDGLGRPYVGGTLATSDSTFTITVAGVGSENIVIRPQSGFVQ